MASNPTMSIKKLLSQYKFKKDSGLLSVKVEGNEHLLKIYFDLGMVVGLSIGVLKNEACFDILAQCRPLEASFIKGCRTPEGAIGNKKEINDRLDGFLATYPIMTGIADGSDSAERSVDAKAVHNLESAFIDLIGPVGKMLIDTAYADIGYRPGTEMSAAQYSILIDRLREVLPPDQQSTFAAK